MLNPTNKVQTTTNTTYDTALQYATTAAKGVGLLTAGYIAVNYFASTPQSPFTGNTALVPLTPLDTHVFSPQNALTSTAVIKDIVNLGATSTIINTPCLEVAVPSPLLPSFTPANFSTTIMQPALPEKSLPTVPSITSGLLLPKTSSAVNTISFKPLLIKAPSLPQSLKNASITTNILSAPVLPTIASTAEILVKPKSTSATNLTIYKEFSFGTAIQKAAIQNPVLENTVETPALANSSAVIITSEDAIEDHAEEFVICEDELPLDECPEEIVEEECHDELLLDSNQTSISTINTEPQCTVTAESLGSRAINLTCNVASKAFDVSCRIGKCVGKTVAKGMYNYLSANWYRRPRIYAAIATCYRYDPRARAGLIRICRDARSRFLS